MDTTNTSLDKAYSVSDTKWMGSMNLTWNLKGLNPDVDYVGITYPKINQTLLCGKKHCVNFITLYDTNQVYKDHFTDYSTIKYINFAEILVTQF